MKYRILDDADADLKEFAVYLGRQQEDLDVRFLDAAASTFELLLESPTLGNRVESRLPRMRGVRRWHVDGFREHVIFYRVLDDGIEILRVVHSASDWARRFGVEEVR